MQLPFDAIATIFIFLIGLPAILLQVLPAEIRRTVLQERKQEVAAFTVGPIVLATALVATGAYLTHPAETAAGALHASRAEVIWLVILSGLLVITGASALLFTERWRRSSVVARLRDSAAAGIAARGRPVETVLRTLAELGVQSQAGQDKGLVIAALAELARRTQSYRRYDGAQLEDVIMGLEDVFTAGAHFGSADNFQASGELLLAVIFDSRDRQHADDLKLAIQAASLLGRASLQHEQSHIQLKFLEALSFAGEGGGSAQPRERDGGGEPAGEGGADLGYATLASRAIFQIGSRALELECWLVAMTALSKLENLVEQHRPVTGDLAYDFIGLLAHCWTKGAAGRDYARRFLARSDELFTDDLPAVIRRAREACLATARFRTSNCLAAMLLDLEPVERRAD